MEAVARSKSGSGPAFPYQANGLSSSDTTDVVQRIASPLRRTSSAFANMLTPSKVPVPMPVPPRSNRLHSTNSSLDSVGKNSFFGSFRGGGGRASTSMSLKDNNVIRQQQQQRRDVASRASTATSTRPPSALLDHPIPPSPLSPDDSADKVMRRSQSVPSGNTLRYVTSLSPLSASRNRSDTAYETKLQPHDVDDNVAVPIPVFTTLTGEAKDSYISEVLVDQQTLYSPDGPARGGGRQLEMSRSSEASAASALLREESGKDTYDKLDLDDCIDVDSDGLDSPRNGDDHDSDGDGSVVNASPGGKAGGDPGLLSPRTNEFLMTQRSHRSDSLDSIPPPTTSSRRLMPTSFMEVTYPTTTEVAQTNKMPKKASQLDMLRHAPVATLNTVLKKKKKRKESGTKTINIERISLYLEGRAMLLQKTYNRHADLTNGIHPIDPLTLVISVPLKEGWLLVREVTEKYRYQNANVWKLRYCILCEAFDSSGPMLFYYPNHEVGRCADELVYMLLLSHTSIYTYLYVLSVLSYTQSNSIIFYYVFVL